MKKLFIQIPFVFTITILLFSACSKEPDSLVALIEGQLEIQAEGRIHYIKDTIGNELARFYYFDNNQLKNIVLNTPDGKLISNTHYKYDDRNRIIEIETIRDTSSFIYMLSCAYIPQKTLIKYTYNDDGLINSIFSNFDPRVKEYHQSQSIEFSKNTDGQIDKMQISFENSDNSSYEEYMYDSTGMLTESEMFMFDGAEYKRYTKTLYIFDDNKNPFSRFFIQDISAINIGNLVFSPIECPNNIISTTTLYYSEMYPEGNPRETTTCFEYNAKGYPIKIYRGCRKSYFIIEYVEE